MGTGYTVHFGMSNTPFTRSIPPGSIYLSPSLKDAKSRLRFGIENRLLAVMLADTGMGKTTILRTVLSELPPGRHLPVYFSEPRLSIRKLYTGMLEQMGIEVRDLRRDIRKIWRESIPRITESEMRKVCCIVDDAHLAEDETLEEIRFIMNKDYDSDSHLSVILIGQTELWSDRLGLSCYEPIRQRIDINISIPRFSREETAGYIQAQLAFAQGAQDIFSEKAVGAIHRMAHGVPRMVNRICDVSLSYAAQTGAKVVDDVMVKEVAKGEVLLSDDCL